MPIHSATKPQRPRLLLVVAAALINPQNEILLTQRPEGKNFSGLWEFPGGKIEPRESPEEALIRELKEELDITADPQYLENFTFASYAHEEFHLLMPLYLLRHWQGEITGLEGQAHRWVSARTLDDYPMPPADKPLISELQKRFSPS